MTMGLEDETSQMETLLANQRDKQKQNHGTWAMIVFIVVSLHYHLTNGTLFTLGALGWFVVGVFASALVLGTVTYLLQKAVAALSPKPPTSRVLAYLKMMGFVLLLVNTTIAVLATRAVYHWLY